ncbi:MAG: response regulator [Chloroflexi bacterium]|nr:response regulator [Chloroflexota bacterium]MYD48254.1 response regulator [Chloroflexota bacterium]
MRSSEELGRENAALRERLSRLSEASLRINESLDLETVLQGALDSARALTEARYGVLIILDDSGQIQDYLSSGMSAEDDRWLARVPGGVEMFRYLTTISAPTRLRDLQAHMRSLGLPELNPPMPVSPALSYLGAPVQHRDDRIGGIYLGEKEGGREFTEEDEETLVMFASQAALVISNAWQHREEQRARADLQALVDTSPVAVVVFDTRARRPVSYNRETRRIFDLLRTPDQLPEDLLRGMTVRRGDGREVPLEEFPIAEASRWGENVRLEEVVLLAPGGRSITALMNVTSIRSEGSEVESVVVTFQDMTPLEELERLRAEFLTMVSHELRTPLTAIKGSAATLISSGDSLDPAEVLQFHRIIDDQVEQMRSLITDLLDVARIETGTLSTSPEASEPAVLVDRARNAFLSGGGHHSIYVDMEIDLPQVMADPRRIMQVLVNLLNNAAKHSPESSVITASARRDGVHVAFSVADEGVGVPTDRLPHLFRKHSRIDEKDPDGIAGSGVGLAICKGIVEAHGGRIWAESEGPNKGARFSFILPVVGDAGHDVSEDRSQAPGRPRQSRGRRTRVLVVDDDPQSLRYVRDTLTEAGFAATVTADPDGVEQLMETERPHLVLLDLMLPGTDGIELLENIPALSDLPVIFISAYGRDELVAKALEAGAEDYIVKPFSPTELVARIHTALRRQTGPEPDSPSEPYVLGDLTIDYAERRVYLAGIPVRLTDLEYRFLCQLSANAGRVMTHENLLQRVWGPGHPGHSGPVRRVVKNLRRKLGDPADNPAYIFNEPRVGYRMERSKTMG